MIAFILFMIVFIRKIFWIKLKPLTIYFHREEKLIIWKADVTGFHLSLKYNQRSTEESQSDFSFLGELMYYFNPYWFLCNMPKIQTLKNVF